MSDERPPSEGIYWITRLEAARGRVPAGGRVGQPQNAT
jgi:hypothetical protein